MWSFITVVTYYMYTVALAFFKTKFFREEVKYIF